MSKLGVGVGEEFPVDEEKKREEAAPLGEGASSDPWCSGPGFGPRFGGPFDDHHEAWCRWRNQMRAEWQARRRAMREHFRSELHGEEDTEAPHRHHPRPYHLVIGALALIGLAALLGHRHHN